MKRSITTLALASILGTLISTASMPAMADHNSPMGEGWANMPNDIHNTRIDTREEDDTDAFTDFVYQGAGADTVNRFLDTSE